MISSGSDSVTLASADPIPQSAEPLRIADVEGFFAQARCATIEKRPDGRVEVTLNPPLQPPIDHAQDSDPKKGTKASDPDYCGRGYKILRCRLGDTRSRGVLVKADDGLIDGCTIRGCGMSGVSIGPEFWWNEAGYCWNVTVSNNKFIECNKNNGDQAAVWIHGDGAIGNRNIVIKNNCFDTCYGPYIIRSDWADGVQIMGNEIARPFLLSSNIPGHVVWLTDSRHVKLLGNSVTDRGPFGGQGLIGMDSSMNPSEVQDLDGSTRGEDR